MFGRSRVVNGHGWLDRKVVMAHTRPQTSDGHTRSQSSDGPHDGPIDIYLARAGPALTDSHRPYIFFQTEGFGSDMLQHVGVFFCAVRPQSYFVILWPCNMWAHKIWTQYLNIYFGHTRRILQLPSHRSPHYRHTYPYM